MLTPGLQRYLLTHRLTEVVGDGSQISPAHIHVDPVGGARILSLSMGGPSVILTFATVPRVICCPEGQDRELNQFLGVSLHSLG